MRLKSYLTTLAILLVLLLTSGCNMFKSLDKPTDLEESKFKEQQALKKGDFTSAIASLEARLDTLSGQERTDAIQTLADSYLGKAGVNVLDLAVTFSDASTSTTSGATDNTALIQTLNNIDFNALEQADKYYAELLGESPLLTIKRNTSSDDSKKQELYLSAALSKALLAAHYLAIVIYDFDITDRIKIEITADNKAIAYKIGDNGELITKPFRNDEALKAKWIEVIPSKNKTFGKVLINYLEKAALYIPLALDSNDSDIKETVDGFFADIKAYGDITTLEGFDAEFIDAIHSFRPESSAE